MEAMDQVIDQSSRGARVGTSSPVVSVEGVSKSYGPVQALLPTSLNLTAGEVHALVGENGSGKSTLVGLLSGAIRPDSGTIRFGDDQLKRYRPWESQAAGVLTVFQDGSLIGDLSIAQNLYLGTPSAQRPPFRQMDRWATERLARYGMDHLTPADLAKSLSPGDGQLLDIVRALMAHPKVLLLDEATSSLDASGVDVALDLMRQAAGEGVAVLFVTHRLSEVFRVASRISVLRDGEWQGTVPASEVDTTRLVELMAGTSVNVEFPQRADAEAVGEPLLTAEKLRGRGYGPVDLQVRRGEIVGVAGADGNGQLELLRGLSGSGVQGGSLTVGGVAIGHLGEATRRGVIFLSSDRREESLFPSLAIRENLVAGVLKKISRGGYLGSRREFGEVDRSVDRFGIRLGNVADPVTSLSGGNQQKVALSRALVTEPEVLLVDEPTKGVDVRSRIDIYHMLRNAANGGRAIVVVSSDAAELAGLCDRIVVLSRGHIIDEVTGREASEERIVHAFVGAVTAHRRTEQPAGTVGTAVHRHSRRLSQDVGRLGLVVLLLLGLGAYAQTQESTFLGSASIYNILLLTLPLAVVAGAEFLVMFTGGIDVSIGANMGLMVAILSFVFASSGLGVGLVLSILLSLGIGLVVGLGNAFVVERLQIPPVIATIATLGILQGLGLVLRPKPAGVINSHVVTALTYKIGPVPVALIVVVAVFLLADALLRGSGRGLRLRAVGLNPTLAYRLGENTPRLRRIAYVGCGALAALAGLMLAAQVGVGDSTVGNQYTLLAIAAPILGGASLLGGRGSFLGCLIGALLLGMAEVLPGVLSLGNGLSYVLAGILTLVAILVYSGTGTAWEMLLRQVRSARGQQTPQGAAEPGAAR